MKQRVAVLRGGPSSEYDVSMVSGNAVLRALAESDKHDPLDITITKAGEWLYEGRPRQPQHVLQGVDTVFIALHGEYGEDGQVQRLLEQFGIPYTGSGSLASAQSFHKVHSKTQMILQGVLTPTYQSVRRHELKDPRTVTRIETQVGQEFFAKPIASGSSVGARRVGHSDDTYAALDELFNHHDELLLESYIDGVEATVGVLEGFRDQSLYVMPVIEIVPPAEADFFDAQVKYDGTTKEIVPGTFPTHIRDELQRIAALAHQTLNCAQYSRSDFLIRDGEVYYLETNTLPGLTEESLYPKAAAAVGLEFKDLVLHLINTAS